MSAKHVEERYEVDPKVLGRGHYGVVRRCVCRATGEACAVKAIACVKPKFRGS
jgi:serine/threonine protein kinase